MKSFLNKAFKKGAASFYVVAFSTLILVIIVTSFAAIIISEVSRTSNDDLAQSAYDSALAGIEDAKLAFYNYRNCLGTAAEEPNGDGTISCGEIIYWMEHPDCDMVAHMLGRIGELESSEVMIQETSNASNDMYQAYTCVKLDTVLSDYRSTISSGDQAKVIQVKLDGVSAKDIKKVRFKWYSDSNGTISNLNYSNISNNGVSFGPGTTTPEPPTMSITLVQTKENFSFSDFDKTLGDRTDRGTLYLVPTGNEGIASGNNQNNPKTYIGTSYNESEKTSYIGKSAFLKSNDKVTKNLPYAVYCSGDGDFYCSVTIELPEPVGGNRSDDTFMFAVSVPYGKPSTDYSLEFLCDGICEKSNVVNEEGETVEVGSEVAQLNGMQIAIDSTGRANSLYRRVESRLEPAVSASGLSATQYVINLGGDGDDTLKKNLTVTSEHSIESYKDE